MAFGGVALLCGFIIGQVITGIGFLGAGVMLSRDGVVPGVTSATNYPGAGGD